MGERPQRIGFETEAVDCRDEDPRYPLRGAIRWARTRRCRVSAELLGGVGHAELGKGWRPGSCPAAAREGGDNVFVVVPPVEEAQRVRKRADRFGRVTAIEGQL